MRGVASDNLESFFIAAAVWGTITERRSETSQQAVLTVADGKVPLDKIVLSLPDASIKPTAVTVDLSGEVIPCVISHEDEIVHIRLTRAAKVLRDDTLTVALTW
jgi:hypothetical protein